MDKYLFCLHLSKTFKQKTFDLKKTCNSKIEKRESICSENNKSKQDELHNLEKHLLIYLP